MTGNPQSRPFEVLADERPLLSITVEGEPCPKARPRSGKGRFYTPSRTRRAESVIGWEAVRAMKQGLDDGQSRFWMTVHFYCSSTWGPDTDNLVKLVMDGLSPRRVKRRPSGPGLIWRNDRQVVRIRATRHDGSKYPRTMVSIGRMHPCPG